MKPQVSATIITLDAERTLEGALAALEWVDEIVVVDSGSGDATLEIARSHGARCLVREWPGYGVQKARAARAARGEWILSVDADEVVSPELSRSIRSAVSDPG
ncbi:MAG TPA: glycosyltransferase, partial [Longimicrobiales bacterium]|nr:glycosyltransferase [Longimicrobiales bacterium]